MFEVGYRVDAVGVIAVEESEGLTGVVRAVSGEPRTSTTLELTVEWPNGYQTDYTGNKKNRHYENFGVDLEQEMWE